MPIPPDHVLQRTRPSQSRKTRLQEFTTALREQLYKSKLIIYGSLLVVGVIQIIIRERFPEVHPPWPLIGGALMVLLFAVLLVPPLLLIIRMRRRSKSGKHEPHS